MSLKKSFITIIFFSLSLFYFGCSTAKEEKTPLQNKVEKIPPGQARINGEVIKILPIDKNSNGPCSIVPCSAMVKVTGTEYGAGFPVIPVNSEIKVEFAFTLSPTTKDLFPNMEDSYPGLKEGQEFTALVSTVLSMEGSNNPKFRIYGYSIK